MIEWEDDQRIKITKITWRELVEAKFDVAPVTGLESLGKYHWNVVRFKGYKVEFNTALFEYEPEVWSAEQRWLRMRKSFKKYYCNLIFTLFRVYCLQNVYRNLQRLIFKSVTK